MVHLPQDNKLSSRHCYYMKYLKISPSINIKKVFYLQGNITSLTFLQSNEVLCAKRLIYAHSQETCELHTWGSTEVQLQQLQNLAK